jgi:general stress protein 26
MSPDRPLALEELPARLWSELVRASRDRHHGWRLPVLATVDPQGSPQARTVVLRGADAALGELVCYTDRRSPKVSQLRADGRGVLVFWCARLSWQLRAQVRIGVEEDGARVQAAWARVAGQPAARDYLAPAPPGTAGLQGASDAGGEPPGVADKPQAAHHLALLSARVTALDWLELDRRHGPRRAGVDAQGCAQWLMP